MKVIATTLLAGTVGLFTQALAKIHSPVDVTVVNLKGVVMFQDPGAIWSCGGFDYVISWSNVNETEVS